MEQLTFEPLVHPDRRNPTPVHLTPPAIEELVALLAEAIAVVFRGGPRDDQPSRSA